MGDTLEATLLGGIILASITALAIIAYKHPAGYEKLFPYLSIILGCSWAFVVICWVVYGAGFSSCISQIYKLNPKELLQTPPFPSVPNWMFIGFIGVMVYLNILRALPLLGITEKHKK